MPRKKKYQESKRLEAEAASAKGRKDRDRLIAKFWSDRIRAGMKAKKDYEAVAAEVMDYFKSNHARLYEDPATRQHFMDFKGAATLSIPKIAQMRASLAPRLYLAKPVRTVTPMTDDGVLRGLALVARAYLNYTVRESKFPKQMRKATDDGLLRGRGLLQQTWDTVRQIITSVYVSSLDFIFDPDFDDIESARWIAIRYREPFWETERRIAEKWRLKDLDKRANGTDDTHAGKDDRREQPVACSNDVIEYWVVLSKMGAGFRGAGMDEATRYTDTKDYCRLEIVLDHGVPIAEGDWDIPLYLDRDWPVSYWDPVETLDTGWPESIAGQVMPCQKGVDLYSSLNLTSCKNRNRLLMLVNAQVDKINQNQFRNGTSADMISVEPPTGQRLADVIHVPQFGVGATLESAQERAFLLQEMEATTGVTNVLTGGEESTSKDRSATASQQRMTAADARVGDLKQKIEELATDTARKEAIAMRLLLDPEDVEKVVRPSAIALYYVKLEVAPGVVMPVRDTRDEDERKAEAPGPLTIEEISPQASNYFDAPEQAWEAASALWADMQMSEDPRVIEIASQIGTQIAEEDGLPVALTFDTVTVQRVWEDTAGISPEEMMREFSYEIATGSGQKVDKAAEQANADNLVQTALPAALGLGDMNAANQIMHVRDEAFDVPQEQRVQFSPPPAPEPRGSGGEDKDDKGGDE